MLQPLASAISAAALESAPVDADVVDVAAPSVEEIILELSFVDEVLHLSADTVQVTEFIELTVTTCAVVAADLGSVVGFVSKLLSFPDDVSSMQDALLLPVGDSELEGLRVTQRLDESWEVLRLFLEKLYQLIGELWCRRGDGRRGLIILLAVAALVLRRLDC